MVKRLLAIVFVLPICLVLISTVQAQESDCPKSIVNPLGLGVTLTFTEVTMLGQMRYCGMVDDSGTSLYFALADALGYEAYQGVAAPVRYQEVNQVLGITNDGVISRQLPEPINLVFDTLLFVDMPWDEYDFPVLLLLIEDEVFEEVEGEFTRKADGVIFVYFPTGETYVLSYIQSSG